MLNLINLIFELNMFDWAFGSHIHPSNAMSYKDISFFIWLNEILNFRAIFRQARHLPLTFQINDSNDSSICFKTNTIDLNCKNTQSLSKLVFTKILVESYKTYIYIK